MTRVLVVFLCFYYFLTITATTEKRVGLKKLSKKLSNAMTTTTTTSTTTSTTTTTKIRKHIRGKRSTAITTIAFLY